MAAGGHAVVMEPRKGRFEKGNLGSAKGPRGRASVSI